MENFQLIGTIILGIIIIGGAIGTGIAVFYEPKSKQQKKA